MARIYDLPRSVQAEIQAQAKHFTYGDLANVLAILTQEPSLPGHSDRGHDTRVIPISTRIVEPDDVHQAYDTVIDLNVIACLSCDLATSPFALFALMHKI